MIACAHSYDAGIENSLRSQIDDWNSLATLEVPHEDHEPMARRLRHYGDATLAAGLAGMCMSSLSAYRRILRETESDEVRELARIVIRERLAQYQTLLGRSSGSGMFRSGQGFPQAEERSEWLMAFWGFESEYSTDAIEHIERAECLLEEAYLAGRNAVADSEFAGELTEFAISVCETRQRWERVAVSIPVA